MRAQRFRVGNSTWSVWVHPCPRAGLWVLGNELRRHDGAGHRHQCYAKRNNSIVGFYSSLLLASRGDRAYLNRIENELNRAGHSAVLPIEEPPP